MLQSILTVFKYFCIIDLAFLIVFADGFYRN